MNGFLLVNKEKGYSSNEIVQKIKKKFSLNKVGHLGTLDPDAEGLLIIAINRATKFSNYFLNSDKSYYVEIKLGKSTTTDDVSGEIIEEFDVKCSEDEVKKENETWIVKTQIKFLICFLKKNELFVLVKLNQIFFYSF